MSQTPRKLFLASPLSEDDPESFDEAIRTLPSRYQPNPVGARLHSSLARKRLNFGGLGSGKTRAMCEHLNQMCLDYPGARVILARRDLGDLRKTTQAEYLERVVHPETIERFNINENTLYYKNSSKCFFMECKTPSNFKSHEIVAYGIDEADENPEGEGKDRLMSVLDGRLRQRIMIGGKEILVPYAGIWTYNPVTSDHWLAKLEDQPTPDMECFQSSTYDNQANLPPDYIPSLLSSLAPWEIRSLIYGERAARPKGNPVIHGFTVDRNVRELRVFHHLPLRRSWDFGFNHPCCSIAQYDPEFRRYLKLREVIGNKEQLKFFAPKVIAETRALVSPGFPVVDVCDPHGADQRDVGESSVEHLRIHHGVFCQFKRQRLTTGLDEIQELVLSEDAYRPVDWEQPASEPLPRESRFLVDPSCGITLAAYLGGYYRDDAGDPVKDDLHDHPVDTDRYSIVHTMGLSLLHRKKQKRYIPKCIITGY